MKTLASCMKYLLLCAALQLLATSFAYAQATRTWVSGVGDDANPCSRTAPCKTFAGAISKTAAGGEISVLDPGGFGAVTITKSITINGDGTLAGILASLTTGIIVNAGVNDVVNIRNLSINGAGTGVDGIRFLAGGKLHVENCTIYGFAGQGLQFLPSGTSGLFLTKSSFRNNAGGAILVLPAVVGGNANVTLDHVVMENNLRGLKVQDGSTVIVQNSIATGNTPGGGFAAASVAARPVDLSLESTVSSLNGTGVSANGALVTVRMSNLMAVRNSLGLQVVNGASIVSFGNNRVHGNTGGDGAPTSSPGEI